MKSNLRHLLVATDGSATSNRAVSFAIALARRNGSDMLLCSVVDHALVIAESSTANGGFGLAFPLVQTLDNAANTILADAAKRVTDAGVPATTVLLDGRPAQAIVKLARDRHVDAIVMGTQGKRGLERVFMGSTADGVLRRSSLPTFVVPPGVDETAPSFERILVAVDDSDPSDASAAFARDFATTEAAHLIFCAVAETSDVLDNATTYGYDPTSILDDLRASASALVTEHAALARAEGITTDNVIAEGDPAGQILKFAVACDVGSIVVGTHGRRGLRRLFVGSVAESIVCRSTVPVIVVRAARLHIEMERESALATGARCYS